MNVSPFARVQFRHVLDLSRRREDLLDADRPASEEARAMFSQPNQRSMNVNDEQANQTEETTPAETPAETPVSDQGDGATTPAADDDAA
jgi:hypothetical protein